MPFVKGVSGNKSGRPKNRPDKRNHLRDMLLPHTPKLIEQVIKQAMQGDMVAAKAVLDRVLPILRPVQAAEQININLKGTTPVDQSREILQAATKGELNLDAALQLIQGITATVKLNEMASIEERLQALEQRSLEHGKRKY